MQSVKMSSVKITDAFVKQTARDYDAEEWMVSRAAVLCYDCDKKEYDMEKFYKILDDWCVAQ